MSGSANFTRAEALVRIQNAKRIVIKVGTSLLTNEKDPLGIDRQLVERLRSQISFLRKRGIDVVLVSSGAVGLGRAMARGFSDRNAARDSQSSDALSRKQALAAMGQGRLISFYSDVFGAEGIPVAQLLLTARDFRDRRSYLNIGHTLQELMSLGALPVVNENDTVSTEELRFGDNDLLSAACSSLFRADMLIILTSVDGFMMHSQRVPFLNAITEDVMREARGPSGPGSGGMQTKIRAGQLCMMTGQTLSILPGRADRPVESLFGGDDIGTIIAGPGGRTLSARKRWLLFARTEGVLSIDEGAVRALSQRGSSLLPAGISAIRGRFLAGDVVDLEDSSGQIIGRGIVNYSYRELQAIPGLSGPEITGRGLLTRAPEVIHRDNLILEQS